MGYRVEWSSGAQNDLKHIDVVVVRRILKKLKWFFGQPDRFKHATLLQHSAIGDARFRIGDSRVIVSVDKKRALIVIIAVGHRREIYQP